MVEVVRRRLSETLSEAALRRPIALAVLTILALAVLIVPDDGESTTGDAWQADRTGTQRAPAPAWRVASAHAAEAGALDLRTPQDPARSDVPAMPSETARLTVELLDALDIEAGSVTPESLRRAGEALGVEVATEPGVEDLERLLAAHRQRIVGTLRESGAVVSSSAPEDEMLRLARFFGLDVGERLRPRDVERLARRAADPSPVFASTGGVHIHAPSRHVVLVGFHQAAYTVARQMNAHERVPMRTLPSRSRATGSRSAADVSVLPGTPVLAPVTGRVVEVQRYALYGRYPDARVRIVPDQNPQMLVSILHVTGPKVRVGDRIVGGRTVIAEESTKFPFVSQIDRFAGSYPHAHIEVRRR